MNTLRTAALMGFLFALMTGIGLVLGGRHGLVLGLGMALVLNGAAFFASDRIALASARAREVGPGELPELRAMVEGLSRSAGIPSPRIYVTPGAQPNAFATGRSPRHAAVAVTEGMLRTLPERELAGVIAHELAHVRNRDILTASVAAALGGAVGTIVHLAMWTGGRDSEGRPANPFVTILSLVLAPMAAMLAQMALSRTREFAADRDGAMIAGDARGLASALRRMEALAGRSPLEVNPAARPMYIVNPLGSASAAGLFRTHPPTAERIARLEALERASLGSIRPIAV